MAKLSGDKTYVTVEKGDTLWGIAATYLGSGTKYTQLAAINNIPNPNRIYVGQIVRLYSSGSTPSQPANTSYATVNQFGLQSDSDGVLFATWSWNRNNTKNYEVEWTYDTGDGVWFVGARTYTVEKQNTYNVPSNAKQVRFRVKPISETYMSNNNTTSYWTADWSSYNTYDVSNLPPKTPPTPTLTIDKYTLVAKIDNLVAEDYNATGVQFQIVKNDSTIFNTGKATINTEIDFVSYSCSVESGAEYKVRCRSYKNTIYSEWSSYSSIVKTIPSTPSKIETCRASSATSVYLSWTAVTGSTEYDIEYATKKEYFDSTEETTVKGGIKLTYFEFIGLESGQEYFFRVRAVNEKGESGWSDIVSVVIGKDPSAPTTWSSTTTVITGEPLTLYWVHNSEDNSSQTFAELEMYINGVKEVHTIENSTDEELKDLTSSYIFDTSIYVEGTEIKWRVRTAGITKVYGDWSIERVVTVYAPPTLELSVTNAQGNTFDVLTSLPFKVYALAGPNTQVPTGYSLTVSANETYETLDYIGKPKTVNAGENIYSKYFDISTPLSVTLSAGDLDLENNVTYTVTCVVSMNSGLTASRSIEFRVAWNDIYFTPNAEISIDTDTIVAHIRPYCEEIHIKHYIVNKSVNTYKVSKTEITTGVYGTPINGVFTETGEAVYYGTTGDGDEVYYCEIKIHNLVEGVTLAVYRRDFDGGFTEIATGIDNLSNMFITDPHPALDFARYRIVATTNNTGSVCYYDVPGYPVGETAITLQWDEVWTNFDIPSHGILEQSPWAGSLLKLPYNIDTSTNTNQDVELVEYIGRAHPVSYYGTQVGQTDTWNVDVVHDDEDTLHGLRRLQNWMGDVYVREPSGVGYWANVTVQFSRKHCDVRIPVTIGIKRVEGGI